MPAIGQCTQMDANRSNESEIDEHNNLHQQPQELHSQSRKRIQREPHWSS